MDNSVEVRYAGVVVGRGMLRDLGEGAPADAASGHAFVAILEPLPVGTFLTLKAGDAVREARVEDVVESADPTAAGMRVSWGGGVKASRPAPAMMAAPAQSVAAAPQQEPSDSGPTSVEKGPTPATEANEDGSDAISAPLSLADAGGNGAQAGGGKKRRKRR